MNVLNELQDDVYCPVCLELFKDPRALECLHTLCKKCIDLCVKNDVVTCPVCREPCCMKNIKSDFKTKKLVKVYRAHEANFAHQTDDRVQNCLYNLDHKLKEVLTECDQLEMFKAEAVKTTVTTAEKYVKEVGKEEERMLAEVKSYYKKQKATINRRRDKNITQTNEHYAYLMDKLQQATDQIIELKRDTELPLLVVQDSVQEIDKQLVDVRRETFPPLNLILNKGRQPFDANKALTVEVEIGNQYGNTSLTEEHGSGFAVLCLLKSAKCLVVTEDVKFSDFVNQLQMVKDKLWALTDSRLKVLTPYGSVINKPCPECQQTQGMSVVGRHVIVADLSKGLLQLTADGQLVQQLDCGSYWAVTSCGDGQSVWAVKREVKNYGSFFCICKFNVQLKRQLVKLETDIDVSRVSCVLVGHKLYVSSYYEHCIFCIDTVTGATQSVHGTRGSSAAGELHHPHNLYRLSKSLLVADQANNRMQIFDTVTNIWSVVRTAGAELKQPTAVVVDDQENFWIGNCNGQLYKCTL